MAGEGPGGRLRPVVLRSILVLVVGGAVLAPILYYASTVDVRPPQVDRFALTQHLPGDDAVALTTASLEVVFSENVDHASAQAALAIEPALTGAFSWSGTTMIFTPASRLPLETRFAVTLRPGVRDLAGNRMGSEGPFSFETVGSPSVIATAPTASASGVPLDASMSITFSTLMDTASVQAALQVVPRTDVDLLWSGASVTIVPREPLQADTDYLVVIGPGATDLAGTALTEPLRLTFTTVPSGLHARAMIPQDTSQGIAVTTPIAVILDRALDPASISDRLITVQPAVAGSVSITPPGGAAAMTDATPRILRFTPSGTLAPNTTYTVTLAAGLRGTDGAQLAGPLTWSFTTGTASPSLGNQVVFLSSRSGIANLWAMNPDGSNQHQLSAELSPVTSYAIAPDGRSYVVGDGARLVEARADGSGRRVLTESGAIEYDPAYAPDGSAIVFGRADAITGSGLGLWTRPPGGGSAERLAIPAPTASPSASGTPAASASSPPASASAGTPAPSVAAPMPLLRAPRYSPDGASLAFVDGAGRVSVVDLASSRLTTVAFHAVAPPAWLPGEGGVLVSGIAAPPPTESWTAGVLTPGTPVPLLSPAGLRISAADRAALRVVQVVPGQPDFVATSLPAGATLPVVADSGRIACLVPGRADADVGSVWISASPDSGAVQITAPDAQVSSISFAPASRTLVVARVPLSLPGTSASPTPLASPAPASPLPTPSPTVTPTAAPDLRGMAGIWLLDAASGNLRQLTTDGWLARWLP